MVVAEVFIDPPPVDLSACAYYRRYIGAVGHDPNGTCSFGCRDEPSCVTDQPLDGWPSEQRAYTRDDMIVVIRVDPIGER